MKKDLSILFISEISFFPMYGGERMRSYGLIKILSRTFKKVYAITGLQKVEESLQAMLPNVEFFPFDFKIGKTKQHIRYVYT